MWQSFIDQLLLPLIVGLLIAYFSYWLDKWNKD